MFLLHPTFCYEANYPLSNKPPSKRYLASKLALLIGALMTIYVVHKDKWIPIIEAMKTANQIQIYTAFYLPAMTVYFVGFYTLFDIAPNFYAELSGLQDRQFYQDFWNSSNFDEYARKWNKLVHEFLYRHFYLEYLINYKCTVYQSSIMTFAFSTLFHELCFVSVFRAFTPYLTTM